MQFNQFALLLTLLVSHVEGFTPSRNALAPSRTHLSMVGAAIEWNPEDDDEAFLMSRAAECADSESCSLEDARMYLDDVIRIQSGCVTGTVLGDVCESVDTAAEVVANLRQKIRDKAKQALIIGTGTNIISVSLLAVLMASLVSGMTAASLDSTPFTPQEWWWAIRDGYLPTMLSHYFRNGGLSTVSYDLESTPFSMQEWWWAFKGGYLNTMMDHFFRNGGLATEASYASDVLPFTPEEWSNAINGGYVDKMVSHNFQNGGLACETPLEADTLALTPQEIFWAARGGYMEDMMEHFFRNGGL